MTANTTSTEQAGAGTGSDRAAQPDPIAASANNYDIEFFWDPI